jgi:hypothetical protein
VGDVWRTLCCSSRAMRAAVFSLLGIAAGACAYKPGAFTHINKSFPGKRTTVGCLDIAIDRRSQLDLTGAVLGYEFGNRCTHPATVDLANVRVLAQTASGKRITLNAFDPRWEIRPLRIDGRMAGEEAIEYRSDEPLVTVCVDAASVAGERDQQWLCFSSDVPPTVAEVSP